MTRYCRVARVEYRGRKIPFQAPPTLTPPTGCYSATLPGPLVENRYPGCYTGCYKPLHRVLHSPNFQNPVRGCLFIVTADPTSDLFVFRRRGFGHLAASQNSTHNRHFGSFPRSTPPKSKKEFVVRGPLSINRQPLTGFDTEFLDQSSPVQPSPA